METSCKSETSCEFWGVSSTSETGTARETRAGGLAELLFGLLSALVAMLCPLLRPAQLQEGLHAPSGPGQLSLCHSSPTQGPWYRSCSFFSLALPPPHEPQAKAAADTQPHQPTATASVQSPGSLPAKALLGANKGFSGCCYCHGSSFLFPRSSSGETQLLSVIQGSHIIAHWTGPARCPGFRLCCESRAPVSPWIMSWGQCYTFMCMSINS